MSVVEEARGKCVNGVEGKKEGTALELSQSPKEAKPTVVFW